MIGKEQKEYIFGQLDVMAEEVEQITDVSARVQARGKYLELFIDMCTMLNPDDSVVHEEPELDEDEVLEDTEEVLEEVEEVLEEETVEEPESVVAETDAVLKESNVVNGDEIFSDAEEVRVVENNEGEEVDITEMYNLLVNAGISEEDADQIGLFVTEYQAIDAYNNKFDYMQHGLPRAYAAYLGANLEEEQLVAYIVDFSGLPQDAVASSTDFITDENAEELFDFVCQ